MNNKLKIAVALTLTSMACLGWSQVSFYTVEANSDRLKIVSTSGSVTDVGALGFNVTNIDLAWHQGTLYGLDQDGSLYSISTGGPATFLGQLTDSGTRVGGEGLASDGTNLYVSYGVLGSNISDHWGTTGLTGVVTGLGTVSDLDGAGYGNANFWGIDLFKQGDNSNNYVYSGYPIPSGLAHIHSAFPGYTTLDENDVVASIGTDLYFITSSGYLTQYAQAAGTFLNDFQLSQTGNYRGLETVPEPSLIVLAGLGIAATARRRNRRCRL